MSSPIGGWIHGSSFGDRPAVRPFLALMREMQKFTESHLSKIKGLVCGIMFGSSVVLPSLYPADLELRALYLFDFGISVGSVILFAVLNRAEIALNGKYTLPGSIVVVTLILVSQRSSLEAFRPYIPISVALGLLETIYVVPWIRIYFQQRNGITLGDYVRATRGDTSRGSYRAAVDPLSIRSIGTFRGNLNQDLELGPHPLDFEHMGHVTGHYPIGRPDSPGNSSSLDLESRPGEAESSIASAGSRSPCL